MNLGGLGFGFEGKIGMSMYKSSEAGVCLGIRDLPWEAPEDHAHENDCHTPDIGLSGVIGVVVEDFGGKIRVAADNARCRGVGFARIVEDGGSAEINELDDVVMGHDAVVELKIAVGKAEFMEILDAVADLAKHTVDFRTTHFARHDYIEEVKGSILHDLGEMNVMLRDA